MFKQCFVFSSKPVASSTLRKRAEERKEEKNAGMYVRRADLHGTCVPDTGRPGLAEAWMPSYRCSVSSSGPTDTPAAAGRR